MSLDVYLVKKVDTGGIAPYECELFTANITHNLGKMANKAGIYKHLWRPEEVGIQQAGELIKPLENALKDMKSRPDYYKQYDSPNGWGVYEHFIEFVEEYLEAAKEHPKADIQVSR